ncbi:MAG: hypothetical protein HYY95_05350 [Candidatus Rokubacteria bacterium]|nr:hypothetical protein [Candidatus Rokubacteria bacterium]MBI3104992.1 hypothetical protein [Candidatus Rokubacteria bacterium]
MDEGRPKASLGQRWSDARPTKAVVFWGCVASVIATMTVGFAWGGWVTQSTAQRMVDVKVEDALVSRLAPMCVVQVSQDPKKDQKLVELKQISSWEQGEYVKKQGWATMPGEREPEGRIAEACARLINK